MAHLKWMHSAFDQSLFFLTSVSALALSFQPSYAGGFLNSIQSANAASVSTAGATAAAEDATTIYYNPAGLTLLQSSEITSTAPIVFLSSKFQDNGTSAALGEPAIGSKGDKDQNFPIPSFFASMALSDRVSVGLGLYVPFGQANTYPGNWIGRYQLERISLKTFDINPAIAFKVSDRLSVGAGLDLQYAHIVRNNALDLGAFCVASIGLQTCGTMGLTPQASDGHQRVAAASWNVGFNLGILYVLNETTRVGLSYRSAVDHNFSGLARFQMPATAAPLMTTGLFQQTPLRSQMTFPNVIGLGATHKINDKLTILADLGWTGWSALRQLKLNFENPVQPDQTLVLNWSDAVRIALGAVYTPTETIELRAGVSWDQTPTSYAFRSAELPDTNQVMLSTGLSYRFNDQFSTILSYSYGQFAPAPVDLSLFGAGRLLGVFRRTSNAIALQTRFEFR